MPEYVYEYSLDGEVDHFVVKHPITMKKIENLNDLFKYSIDNPGKVYTVCNNETFVFDGELSDIYVDVPVSRIVQSPNVHFKGSGWCMSGTYKYKGKNKRLYEKLREERSRRKSKNISIVELNKELNISSNAGGSIVSNKEWDKMSKENKKIAQEHGIRPSKNFQK